MSKIFPCPSSKRDKPRSSKRTSSPNGPEPASMSQILVKRKSLAVGFAVHGTIQRSAALKNGESRAGFRLSLAPIFQPSRAEPHFFSRRFRLFWIAESAGTALIYPLLVSTLVVLFCMRLLELRLSVWNFRTNHPMPEITGSLVGGDLALQIMLKLTRLGL